MTRTESNNLLLEVLMNPQPRMISNHFIADCPFCSKEQHFYVNAAKANRELNNKDEVRGCWDCKKCKQSGNLKKLFAKLNKLDLIIDGRIIDPNQIEKRKLIVSRLLDEDEIDIETEERKMPVGFKRSYDDPYLISRGFTNNDFEKYVVGRAEIMRKFKEYVFLSLMEEKVCRGYLGRSIHSKEYIDGVNDKYKLEGSKKRLARYRNSKFTDFSKLLLGYDEVSFMTEWVILVEGWFDKVALDRVLSLDSQNAIKCCSKFGKGVSLAQIKKLHLKGVENIILIEDPDAINETKKSSIDLQYSFSDVRVGFTDGGKDLDESTPKEIDRVFETLRTPESFSLNVIGKKKLK